MKIHRLNREETRMWRQNTPLWLDKDGKIVREATAEEVKESFKHNEEERRKAISAQYMGQKYVPNVFSIDDLTLSCSRDVITAEKLKTVGDCILKAINGRFLKSLRDPSVVRPTASQANRTAPSPEFCICKDWGEPHPGHHHPICQFNQIAPPNERAFDPNNPPYIRPHRVSAVPIIPSPDECVCKSFAWPEGEEKDPKRHHPICEHREAWENRADSLRYRIVDLETKKPLRDASREEITQSKQAEEEFGAPIVTIDGKRYGVEEISP